jgi:hypothetical protein
MLFSPPANTAGDKWRLLTVGERVAYAGPFYESTSAYAEERNVPAACLIMPRDSTARTAAGERWLRDVEFRRRSGSNTLPTQLLTASRVTFWVRFEIPLICSAKVEAACAHTRSSTGRHPRAISRFAQILAPHSSSSARLRSDFPVHGHRRGRKAAAGKPVRSPHST